MVYAYIIISFIIGASVYLLSGVAWWGILLMAVMLLPVVWAHKPSRFAVGVYIPAVLFVQVFKIADMGSLVWLAFAGTWVVVAHYTLRHGSPVSAALYLSSALCYPLGRLVAGADFSAISTGFPYLLAANIFAIIAILYAGWRGGVVSWDNRSNSRGWGLANSFSLWNRYPDSYPLSSQEKAQKVKVPK